MSAGPDAAGTGAGPFSAFEFMLALRYLRARRQQAGVTLVAIISFVGIMLAVTALIAVMSIMNGFRHELLTRLLGVQPHVYVQLPQDLNSQTSDLADAIAQLPGVRQAGPVTLGQALVTSARGQAAFAQVNGVRASDFVNFDIVTGAGGVAEAGGGLVSGTAEGFGEGRNGGDIIVIGSAMAARLGVSAGDDVTLVTPRGAQTALGVAPRSKTYLVGAVLTVGVQDLDSILVYMPIEQAALFFNRSAAGDYIDVRLTNPDAPEPVIARINAIAPPGALVFDWRVENAAFWNALQVERIAMRLILSIIVAIAALNIISGVVMLVKNKTRDIAILRTMGATRGAVMRIFLIAGATIGSFGTLCGIVLGLLFVAFIGPIQDGIALMTGVNIFDPTVYKLYRLPARVDWTEVVFVSAWGFAMALLATLLPSWRAGRIDPVEALRNE
ncbi:MAG: lipoprotein-releasing ABC transporter permease subunit [Alphaproteobacteria bacterium]|nr:lipoprotein-releasing ABC transporter permease subunit [Alphaproteobacteria bacterium]